MPIVLKTKGDVRFQEQPGAKVVTLPGALTPRKFDRLIQFDERSRKFPIRTVVPKVPRSYTWRVGLNLDQGSEGACVGFAWAHELAARPVVQGNITNDLARRVYHEAQKIDEWPGEAYDGTSVLAGAKIVQSFGAMSEYRWAFGLEDLRLAVGHAGPAVLGIDWYEGMWDTDGDGFIHTTGEVVGGHAICCYGVDQKNKFFRLHNSWGENWGIRGACRINFADMEILLAHYGEACIPTKRIKVAL